MTFRKKKNNRYGRIMLAKEDVTFRQGLWCKWLLNESCSEIATGIINKVQTLSLLT